MKTKIKTFVKKSVVYLSVMFVCACILTLAVFKSAYWIEDTINYLFPAYIVPSVNVPGPKPLTMKEWVLKEVTKAGMDAKLADAIITCESKWNPDNHAVNWKNQAGVDRGLWQINSVAHKNISNACAYDYKCATKEAIKIYKSRGNYSAWSCLPVVLAKY